MLVQVVEATTANGVCTIRIKALPLPSQLASLLDNNADVLQRAVTAEDSRTAKRRSPEAAGHISKSASSAAAPPDSLASGSAAAAAEANRHYAAPADPHHAISESSAKDGSVSFTDAGSNGSAVHASAAAQLEENGSSISAGLQAMHLDSKNACYQSSKGEHHSSNAHASRAGALSEAGPCSMRSTAGVRGSGEEQSCWEPSGLSGGTAGEVIALRDKLLAAAEEAGGDAASLLRRAWFLGPRQVCHVLFTLPDVLLMHFTWHLQIFASLPSVAGLQNPQFAFCCMHGEMVHLHVPPTVLPALSISICNLSISQVWDDTSSKATERTRRLGPICCWHQMQPQPEVCGPLRARALCG